MLVVGLALEVAAVLQLRRWAREGPGVDAEIDALPGPAFEEELSPPPLPAPGVESKLPPAPVFVGWAFAF